MRQRKALTPEDKEEIKQENYLLKQKIGKKNFTINREKKKLRKYESRKLMNDLKLKSGKKNPVIIFMSMRVVSFEGDQDFVEYNFYSNSEEQSKIVSEFAKRKIKFNSDMLLDFFRKLDYDVVWWHEYQLEYGIQVESFDFLLNKIQFFRKLMDEIDRFTN